MVQAAAPTLPLTLDEFLTWKPVYVYTSRKHVTICLDDDVCPASPVLPDFSISVNTLFAVTVA